MIDAIISYVIGALFFVGALVWILIKVYKKNPSLLRPVVIQAEAGETESTFNWNQIWAILRGCIAFSGAMTIMSNLVIFLLTGKWVIDYRSTFVIVIAFAVIVFQEFDKFVTKMLR